MHCISIRIQVMRKNSFCPYIIEKRRFLMCKTPFSGCKTPFSDVKNAVF